MLIANGAAAFLGKLRDFPGLPCSSDDVADYQEIHSQCLSRRSEPIVELLPHGRFSRLYAELAEHLSPAQLDAFLNHEPRATAQLGRRTKSGSDSVSASATGCWRRNPASTSAAMAT